VSPTETGSITAAPAADLYLDLLKKALTRALIAGAPERHTLHPSRQVFRLAYGFLRRVLSGWGLELVRVRPWNPEAYLESGHAAENRIEDAESMVGLRQFDHMEHCIHQVVQNNVPGDLLEAGVWRGGMCIFMRGALKALGETGRRVWVVDSFEGLPPLDTAVDKHPWKAGDMAVPLEKVKRNFARYDLLDDNVQFLKGFFCDTLPGPVGPLAILRVDADLYTSTTDVLQALYSRLSPGGFAIFDDYQNLPDCRRAIDEFRANHHITEPIQMIDRRAAYWQKQR